MHRKNTLKSRRIVKRLLSQWQLYVLILPAVVYLILFNYVPMYGVQIAFRDYRISKGIAGSNWVGLKHFIAFINYPNFSKIILNTLRISLYSFATFPLSIILALMLNEVDNRKYKKVVQMITYAPYFISTVVVCSMLTLFLNRNNGLLNNIIELCGGERVAFLENPKYFATIYVWSDVWSGIGWGTIIYLSALSGVSPDLVEAAKIDGASRFQIVLHVDIPTILPTIIITLIMRCGGILSVGFDKTYLLQNSLNLEASQVISTYVYELGLQSGRFSYSSAIGLFNTVINVAILIIVNAISKRVAEISLW